MVARLERQSIIATVAEGPWTTIATGIRHLTKGFGITTTSSDITKNQDGYVPGSCNIGPGERAARRRIGIISAIGAVALFSFLLATNAGKPWRLMLFLPVAGAAMGFLQDRMHFCAGYGFKGVLNVLGPVGETEDVMTAEFRKQDKQKALQITGLSVATGVVVTVLAMLI